MEAKILFQPESLEFLQKTYKSGLPSLAALADELKTGEYVELFKFCDIFGTSSDFIAETIKNQDIAKEPEDFYYMCLAQIFLDMVYDLIPLRDDYLRGIIYEISDGERVYIGSTMRSLAYRRGVHASPSSTTTASQIINGGRPWHMIKLRDVCNFILSDVMDFRLFLAQEEDREMSRVRESHLKLVNKRSAATCSHVVICANCHTRLRVSSLSKHYKSKKCSAGSK